VVKPFDATLNTLIDAHLTDRAGFLAARSGVQDGPAEPLDTDLSTTLQADRLFRVNGPVPAVIQQVGVTSEADPAVSAAKHRPGGRGRFDELNGRPDGRDEPGFRGRVAAPPSGRRLALRGVLTGVAGEDRVFAQGNEAAPEVAESGVSRRKSIEEALAVVGLGDGQGGFFQQCL